jgi:hypothetical protein
VTQRVLDKEGTLRALLTVAIKLEVFARFYDVITLPKKSFLAVTDHNGIRMFYYPAQYNTNPIGKPFRPSHETLPVTVLRKGSSSLPGQMACVEYLPMGNFSSVLKTRLICMSGLVFPKTISLNLPTQP